MLRSFLFLGLALFTFWPLPALAQNTALAGFSEAEKVGFAFYHLIGQEPPFDKWIVNRPDYKEAKPNVRLALVDFQRQRLREGFSSYFLDKDLITVKINAQIRIANNPEAAKNPASDRTRILEIDYAAADGQSFFPFQLGELWIGVIPEGLDQLDRHYMTEVEYADFCTQTKICGGAFKPYEVQITVRPNKADGKEPIVIGDVPVWLMMADLGNILLLNRHGEMAWEYTTPWYEGQRASSLMTLFAK